MPKNTVANNAAQESVPNISIRPATEADLAIITKLHERAFGPGRFARTAYRAREGTRPVSDFCRVAVIEEKLVGAVRMTKVTIGNKDGALLLGPLAVDPALFSTGLGGELITNALQAAKKSGVELVLLVGDEPYYGKLGFSPVPPGQIEFPGPVNPKRILAVQLKPNSLPKFDGILSAQFA